MSSGACWLIRPAIPAEYAAAGELTVAAYLADDLLAGEESYADMLRATAARARQAELLVAVDPEGGQLLGTVTFARKESPWAELAADDEAEFRMLAVSPAARRHGVGEALIQACVERARQLGCAGLVISTLSTMHDAHRLYARAGFEPTPARDWGVGPVRLLAYRLPLDAAAYCGHCGRALDAADHAGCAQRTALEPPRWCPTCGRRTTVQVTPTGWRARCSRHGERSG